MLQGEVLVAGKPSARQEHDRKVDPLAPQLLQQLEARIADISPVENDEIRRGQHVRGGQDRPVVAKSRYLKALFAQFIRQHVPKAIVPVDGDDTDLRHRFAAHQE